jgi:lipopolysaccharide transport system permease protein
MFCGMTLFAIFAESVTRAPELVLENPSYVKRVVFPLEILPVSVLGAAVALSTVNVAILVVGVLVTRHTLPLTAVLFPLMLLPLVMLSLGLAWFFASLGVFLRDVKNVVAIAVSPVLFFLSPVFYPVKQLPDRYQSLVRLNPLTTILEGGRQTLIWGEGPDWVAWTLVTLLGWVVMQLGYAWFMKSK